MSVKKVREEDSQGNVIYKETSSDMVVREDGTTVEDGLKEAEAPTFDDTGTVSGINSFQTFYQSIVSKMPFINFLRNFKAGLNFIVNTGQIVNNGTTNQAGFVLDARMGKVLQDKITELDSNMALRNSSKLIPLEEITHSNYDLEGFISDTTAMDLNFQESFYSAWSHSNSGNNAQLFMSLELPGVLYGRVARGDGTPPWVFKIQTELVNSES